jgi:hypothetical protein
VNSFNDCMKEYRSQLKKGVINQAYKGLMEYILNLRTYFQNNYPDYFVSGNIYFGYMDMTYFSFMPESLKSRKLKIAIVFIHDTCRFEVWLAGYNKQVQTKYWNLLTESGWKKYSLVPTTKNADSILEHVLVEDPDFNDLDALTKIIEKETMSFVGDVESFLSEH